MKPGPHLLAAVALALLPLWAASAATLQVHPGGSIAAAVARAAPGDTIEVARGLYAESLRIDKPLTLRGVGRPTLSAGGHGDVIRVTAPDVRIEGLILRDSGGELGEQHAGVYLQPGAHRAVVRGCDFANVLFGLWIEKADHVRVEDNLITGMRHRLSSQRGNGIQLYNSQHASILRNRIAFARDGIYVDVSHDARFIGNRMHDVRYGSHYMNSYRNLWQGNDSYRNQGGLALMEVRELQVLGNRTWDNSDHGIMLRTIQDSTIASNIAAGNGRGLFIYDAEYNVLRDNLIVGNRIGVHLWAGSYRNQIDGNDFIGNDEQVRYVASRDAVWGQRQGNHWSNYLGWDQDGDGAGDTPFEASDAVDRLLSRHPFVKLLDSSPALHTLKLIARQFPVLRTPTIVDERPAIAPHHPDWAAWLDRRDGVPEKHDAR
ncbi:nitrous oxide reductase family maturation protein NosD [Xanthomonas sp. XNM01]|uniref:nitrous oxide reductase family maturation protein NosD n=1 Tax=Xanthomonas sp. XNM01 TaxID=2769289 RepID=UPI00177DF080|nr:nitrous oxide reductase family maturation protein NosD [Xanthomonas sp. XNM01]MBD9367121.1 nitrous oxide reductase family maturation protein NosD [Xanthomonas sp. XNM01]